MAWMRSIFWTLTWGLQMARMLTKKWSQVSFSASFDVIRYVTLGQLHRDGDLDFVLLNVGKIKCTLQLANPLLASFIIAFLERGDFREPASGR